MKKAPNILVICSDEHAREFSGCYGNQIVRSPTIDRLSQSASVFDRAYTPSPICVPARAALATGLQVHQLGCWSSSEPYCGEQESWMHRIRDRGVPVMSFGKLHFRSSDDDNGFSEEFLPMHVLINNGVAWPQALIRNPLPPFDETVELADGVGAGESEYTHYDRRVLSSAVTWLNTYSKKIKNNPWAMFVSFVSPHYPLSAPKRFYDWYKDSVLQLPERADAAPSIQHPVLREMRKFWDYDDHFDDPLRLEAIRCYYGLVSFVDDNIRQLLKALEDTGQLNDTVILYLSDHGEMLGQYGFWTKSVMYERSAGIPLIAAGPGFRPRRCQVPVSLTDVGATIEYAIDGCSTFDQQQPWRGCPLQEIADSTDDDRFVFSEYHDGGTPVSYYMIRHKNLKFVHYADGYDPQMFNLDDDPMEAYDLAGSPSCQNQLEAMQQKLNSVLDPQKIADRCAQDQSEKLKRLGGREAVLSAKSFNFTPVQS